MREIGDLCIRQRQQQRIFAQVACELAEGHIVVFDLVGIKTRAEQFSGFDGCHFIHCLLEDSIAADRIQATGGDQASTVRCAFCIQQERLQMRLVPHIVDDQQHV